MNKIVRQHYPVERLPIDLRGVVGAAKTVTVTIEAEVESTSSDHEASAMLDAMKQARDRLTIDPEEDPVARIRRLRDEWDR